MFTQWINFLGCAIPPRPSVTESPPLSTHWHKKNSGFARKSWNFMWRAPRYHLENMSEQTILCRRLVVGENKGESVAVWLSMTWKFWRKKKLATQKGKKLRKESGNAFVAKPRLFFTWSYQMFEWCIGKGENFCSFLNVTRIAQVICIISIPDICPNMYKMR